MSFAGHTTNIREINGFKSWQMYLRGENKRVLCEANERVKLERNHEQLRTLNKYILFFMETLFEYLSQTYIVK